MTKIAACQITSTPDVDHNLKISETVIRGAVKDGAKVIFLPEAADFITDSAHECFLLSAPISNHTYLKGIQSLAKELQVTILVGIHDLPEPGSAEDKEEEEGSERVFNTQVVVGTHGQIVEIYRKVHLFDVKLKGDKGETSGPNGPSEDTDQPEKRTGESLRIRPGKKICDPVSTVAGKVGLEICYDIRFPEIHSILRDKGADIIALPSAFTLKTGKAHWATLLKSIAITYQVFVVAAAQVGAHTSSRSSWGETLVFSPWGTELGRLRSMDDVPEDERSNPLKPEFVIVDLNLGEIEEVRGMIPVEGQRRIDVYNVPREV
ncbi:Carbon-nitrogen hydrolase [Phaffia rhodozyma]|uniref:Carbon-nitrogen hydrolase n=1 Tax=Phaffia rhodozyma TaxID=264483 RepID=A0A0F7SXP5_PHARH|nr:Carbon-nitrogen hydrolase [Phaffia rhodozyma]